MEKTNEDILTNKDILNSYADLTKKDKDTVLGCFFGKDAIKDLYGPNFDTLKSLLQSDVPYDYDGTSLKKTIMLAQASNFELQLPLDTIKGATDPENTKLLFNTLNGCIKSLTSAAASSSSAAAKPKHWTEYTAADLGGGRRKTRRRKTRRRKTKRRKTRRSPSESCV